MAESTGKTDFEAAFQENLKVAEQANQEYIEVYKRMVDKLSVAHLDPFAEILLKHDNSKLMDADKIIEAFKKKILNKLLYAHNKFWEESHVADSIVAMELLKKQFKSFENTDWSIIDKTPTQRMLNVRMRLKQLYVQKLNNQINHQNEVLKNVYSEVVSRRAEVQAITQSRLNLMEKMKNFQEKIPQLKAKLVEMQIEVIEPSSNLTQTTSECTE